jgi:hypothetical protein
LIIDGKHILNCISMNRKFSVQQWQDDLRFLVTSMESIHPNLFHDVTQDAFQHEVAILTDAIPHLDDNEILVGLLKLTAMTQDWHTQIISRNLTKKWFPVRIEQLQDGLFITAVSPEYAEYLGGRVLRIGNCPGSEAFNKIKGITAHDNLYSQRYFASMFMSIPSVLCGLHIIADENTLQLDIQPLAGGQREVKITAGAYDSDDDLTWFWLKEAIPANETITVATHRKPLPLYWQNANQNYWFEFLDPYNTVYMGFNQTANDETESFADFNIRLWDLIDRQDVEHLVIDLRHNLGGDHDILSPLIDGILQRERINRRGGLFVIIGPKNVSASSHCAAWLEKRAQPTFVGEPTGARPNQYADPEHLRLPNSQLRLMVSKLYWQNDLAQDARPWIEPHILAAFDSADYFGLRDPAMEKVMDLL